MLCSTPLSRRNAQSLHVVVVDPQWKDYAALLEELTGKSVGFHFLRCGRDALRLARTHGADLWVVHVGLLDMPAFDLCAMLKDGRPDSVIYLVADDYDIEDERAARGCGASLFTCKPVQAAWFEFLEKQTAVSLMC
jgi:DNA-binding response OmpR family regulator